MHGTRSPDDDQAGRTPAPDDPSPDSSDSMDDADVANGEGSPDLAEDPPKQ